MRDFGSDKRLYRSGAVLGLAVSLALFAGGCGGSGKKAAPAGTSSSAPTQSAPPQAAPSQGAPVPSGSANPLMAYAECMRKNGLPTFQLPQSGGGVQLPPGIDPNSPAFQKAQAACAKYQPQNGQQPGPGGGPGLASPGGPGLASPPSGGG